MDASDAAAKAMDLELSAAMAVKAYRCLPGSLDIANIALRRVLELCRQGAVAPGHTAPTVNGKISIVVCSHIDERFDQFRRHLEQKFAGEDWELVRVSDAESMCEGYRRGLALCTGELIVLSHDDVGFLGDSPARDLRAGFARGDLFGVAGTDRLDSAAWWASGGGFIHSWVSRPTLRGGYLLGMLGGTTGCWVPGAQALDGMIMAAHRGVLLSLGFDADRFDAFHFYDLDLTWRAYKEGLRTGIALDIGTWHASGGNFDKHWSFYAGRFVQKHPELRKKGAVPSLNVPFVEVNSELEHRSLVGWLRHFVDQDPAHPVSR